MHACSPQGDHSLRALVLKDTEGKNCRNRLCFFIASFLSSVTKESKKMIIPIGARQLFDEFLIFERTEVAKLDRRSTSSSQARTIVFVLIIVLIFSLILWGYDSGNRQLTAAAGRPHEPMEIPINAPGPDTASVSDQENRQRDSRLGQIDLQEISCDDSISTDAGEFQKFESSEMRPPEKAKVRSK